MKKFIKLCLRESLSPKETNTVYGSFKTILKEQMIDGQDMNNGTETLCNKMSVATYEEGINLIISAIGKPSMNPKLWNRISKPLKFWKEENIKINKEKKDLHMTGDSMVDESNTWWAAIQSTICEQGPDFE